MTKKIVFLALVFTLVWATAVSADPAPQAIVIDDFESYADRTAMESAWPPYEDSPELDLSAVAHNGSQAMELTYDLTLWFLSWVSHDLPQDADWTGMQTLTVWYQGNAANSGDYISLQVLDSSNDELVSVNVRGGVQDPGWNRWDVSLTNLTAEQLQDVDAIVLGVEADPGGIPGSGTVYFDDISVTNGVQTVWMGNGTNWNTAANWTADVPTATTDALIPASPESGTTMPTLRNTSTVHDLEIEHGASLNLAGKTLNVTGTLLNHGTLTDMKEVGANAEETFLSSGGHPGLLIKTGPEETALARSADSPALGETSVLISAGQPCATGTISRCYNITPTTQGTADITFYFDAGDLNGQACEELALYNYHNEAWVRVAGPGDDGVTHQCNTANFSVTVDGISQFSTFTLAGAVPVAVTLLDINISPQVPLTLVGFTLALIALTAVSIRLLFHRD